MRSRDQIDRASDELDRAATEAGDAAHHAREAIEAGAAGVLERGAETVRDAGRTVGRVAEGALRADADVGVERSTRGTVEKVVHGAGSALQSAAPAVGRGTEIALNATGTALSAASKVLGLVIGKIAGRVGGWWNGAADAIENLPEAEHQACLAHFESYTTRPAGMTFETALPGYTIGYVASRNPDYRGRRFEEIEPDLRHGFGSEFDDVREFSRFGFERGGRGSL